MKMGMETHYTTEPNRHIQLNRDLRRWIRDHHGVVSREEALRIGATVAYIRARLDRGDWTRMYCAVYRDTAVARTSIQDLRGAYVATRVGVVSHASAAWLWGLFSTAPTTPELSVGTATGEIRRPLGVIVHRCADLDVSQAVAKRSVLVTNPLRTLVDLAVTVSPAVLANAVDTAIATKLLTMNGVTAELDRLSRRGRRGLAALRWQLVHRGFIGAPAPSVLEAKALRLVVATHLPLPTVELKVGEDGEYRLDLAWPDILFAIEVDGYLWHFSPEHAQRDLNRRNRLQEAGWTLRVYTWRDVCDEPARVIREITAAYDNLQATKT